MIEPITVYTEPHGFDTWEIDISMPNELSDQSRQFPKNTQEPFFELWERFPVVTPGYQFFGKIDWKEFGERDGVYFPKWTAVLHFLKEYLPVFKGILELELESIKLRNHYEVHKQK